MKTNKTKEYITGNLNEFLADIEVNKIYKIYGEDFKIKISPINYIEQNKSTSIDFRECGKILKKKYNLTKDNELTTFQIEIELKNNKSLTNQVEYALFDQQKNKLNLSYCENISIIINHEIKNNSLLNTNLLNYYNEQGIDILNIEDNFFNNLCYPYAENKTDIILKDRIENIYQNFSKCDTGCKYKNSDLEKKLITCVCQIKTEINTEIQSLNFAFAVKKTFKDSNFYVIKCYDLVFNLENLKSNIGFLFFSVLTITQIPLLIYYFINGIKSIKEYVTEEMKINNYNEERINNPPLKKFSNRLQKFKSAVIKQFNYDNPSNLIYENNNNEKSSSISKLQPTNKLIKTKKKKLKKTINKVNFKKDSHEICSKNSFNKNHSSKIIILNQNNNDKNKKKDDNIKRQYNFKDYCIIIKMDANNPKKKKEPYESKYILDNYEYGEALKYEKRTFWRIMYIFLLYKENILNTFVFKSPFLLKTLRVCLFNFYIASIFALNAFFYFNKKISDRYKYEGEISIFYSLINNIVIVVFSSLISYVLVIIFKNLIDAKRVVRNVFRIEENKMKNNKKYSPNNITKDEISLKLKKIFQKLKIKILIFILIEFLMVIFFWYFATAFCAVYFETQYSWLYDSFTSLLMSIIFKVLLCFTLSSIYITSLRNHLDCVYKIIMFIYKFG